MSRFLHSHLMSQQFVKRLSACSPIRMYTEKSTNYTIEDQCSHAWPFLRALSQSNMHGNVDLSTFRHSELVVQLASASFWCSPVTIIAFVCRVSSVGLPEKPIASDKYSCHVPFLYPMMCDASHAVARRPPSLMLRQGFIATGCRRC